MTRGLATIAVLGLLAGCGGGVAPASGPNHTVHGLLANVGGPAPVNGSAGVYPFAGEVTVRGEGLTMTVTAGVDGRFTVDLPDGRYVAEGHGTTVSPGADPIVGNPCRSEPFQVAGTDVNKISVICPIK
jgi:hypothetical protein